MESMPAPCYNRPNAGLYAEKHDPFMYFDDVLHNGCAQHVLPYPGVNALVATLDSPNAPDFVSMRGPRQISRRSLRPAGSPITTQR
jgi:hypothetical protein